MECYVYERNRLASYLLDSCPPFTKCLFLLFQVWKQPHHPKILHCQRVPLLELSSLFSSSFWSSWMFHVTLWMTVVYWCVCASTCVGNSNPHPKRKPWRKAKGKLSYCEMCAAADRLNVVEWCRENAGRRVISNRKSEVSVFYFPRKEKSMQGIRRTHKVLRHGRVRECKGREHVTIGKDNVGLVWEMMHLTYWLWQHVTN